MNIYHYSPEKRFKVSNKTLQYTPYTFNSKGEIWEIESINRFFSLIDTEKSFNIIDIGAQSGSYTLYSKFLPKSKFYSFEPFPMSYSLLLENIELNHITNVETFNIALSNKREEKKLKVCDNHNGLHTLGETPLRFSNYSELTIQTDTIDNIFYDKIKVDFIKIDTEGFEFFILQGGEKTIRKDRPVIQIEWNETNMKQCNVNSKDVSDFIHSIDYGMLIELNSEERIIYPKEKEIEILGKK